jgi:photosystem II stability/assembly factor-like uncharacterized protein
LTLAWALLLAVALVLGAAACGSSSSGADAYGGAQNHLHDLLALTGVPNTVLLATHIGLYRSSDGGAHWTEVAGGAHQPMDGLMIFKLAQSLVDPQRVYVLAIPRTGVAQPGDTASGIYTSTDAGRTWSLAAPVSAFPAPSVYTIAAGDDGPSQVFALMPALGAQGLYASDDAGKHWHPLPVLPTTAVAGVRAVAGHPGRLLLWSASDGLFETADGGMHWRGVSDVHGGVFALSVAGDTVYASADTGLYRSDDAGGHFTLADAGATYSAVIACEGSPAHAYALTGTAVYVSTDSGGTWHTAAGTKQHPGLIAADPQHPGIAYVGLSYPIGVERTTDAGSSWRAVLP